MNINKFINQYKFRITNKMMQLSKHTKIGIFAGAIGCILLGTVFVLTTSTGVYSLTIAGENVGYIADKSIIHDAMKDITSDYADGKDTIDVDETSIVCKKTNLDKKDIKALTVKEVENKLIASGICTMKGWSVNIEGKNIVAVQSKEEAKQILTDVKNYYTSKDSTVMSATFKEKVRITQAAINIAATLKPNDAVTFIITGEKDPKVYTVKEGDTLWGIAAQNGMSVSELQNANPGFDPNQLKIGQQVNLFAVKPYLTVETKELISSTEKIDFNTVFEETNSLYKGETKVKTPGVYGSKEISSEVIKENGVITASKVIDSVLTAEPQNQVALKGTKTKPETLYVASRGQNRSVSVAATGNEIVAYAKKFIGVPYCNGGTSPNGFDCSGFTQYVYSNFGGNLPHSSASQYNYGSAVDKSQLQPGDLVFFASSSRISHVGIYVGGGKFIHSPQSGDRVKISSFSTSNLRYCGAVRITT
ncbi:C40 family peptidase [Clostridium aminobutyricum]|uniref:C40 family peptidase n=1 Tax=Clostridium aminobutyricum TaxID=33953 RepID=A0A939IID4_CLOAM|nr:C40 family peptidase [Clostridium aminobutyricum]MBN7772379.1 C40 family peptidase [Clostridium aminobutyricum]